MKAFLSALALGAGLVASLAMAADEGTQIGVLTCKLTKVDNIVVYTTEEFDCEFKPNSGDSQSYTGTMKSVGINLSVTKDATMVWGVVAPSRDVGSDKILAGTYAGGSAKVALVAGGSANVLIGGGDKSITLQPFSVTGMQGYGAALELSAFELK